MKPLKEIWIFHDFFSIISYDKIIRWNTDRKLSKRAEQQEAIWSSEEDPPLDKCFGPYTSWHSREGGPTWVMTPKCQLLLLLSNFRSHTSMRTKEFLGVSVRSQNIADWHLPAADTSLDTAIWGDTTPKGLTGRGPLCSKKDIHGSLPNWHHPHHVVPATCPTVKAGVQHDVTNRAYTLKAFHCWACADITWADDCSFLLLHSQQPTRGLFGSLTKAF